jgi:adenylate kinase
MFNLILFGPPGSGKGTQSVKIAEKFQLKHISTGEILRNEIKKKSKLGLLAKALIDKGELVPDNLLIEILYSVFENNKGVKGFIFDGFPRTIFQAEELDKLLSKLNDGIFKVISLDVADEEVIGRLLKRAEIERRKDDNKETINNRLKVYKQQTAPLLNYYKNQDKLVMIDGVGSVDDIFNVISDKLKQLIVF